MCDACLHAEQAPRPGRTTVRRTSLSRLRAGALAGPGTRAGGASLPCGRAAAAGDGRARRGRTARRRRHPPGPLSRSPPPPALHLVRLSVMAEVPMILLALLAACLLEKSDAWGPDGTVPLRAETVVSGLEVPWSSRSFP